MAQRLIGPSAAATILGRSSNIVRYWGRTGRLRPARLSPMRFRVDDVVRFREVLRTAPPETRGRKPGSTELARMIREAGLGAAGERETR